MPRGSQAPGIRRQGFYLGNWKVEPQMNRIGRNGESVRLELKAMEVLVYLACHGTSLVTRKQLIDGVWDGGFISDNQAAMVVIHEALHHAGLSERPRDRKAMNSGQISAMVEKACGL